MMTRNLEFLFEISSLRNVRRSWIQQFGITVANLSEHTFRVVWIALMIAIEEKNSNIDRIVKMALIHDIAESRTGDATPVQKKYVKMNEEEALSDMLEDLGFKEEFMELFEEYHERKTIESKIVKDADNLDVDIELAELVEQGHKLAIEIQDRRRREMDPYFTESARKLFKELDFVKPRDWHYRVRDYKKDEHGRICKMNVKIKD